MMLHGFDVSAFQGSAVPTCDFAFVKATEGSGYTSSRFDSQWASAKRNAHVRGAYHFARPEESTPEHQADRLLALARPVAGELLCLDLEASKLSQTATNSWARIFGDHLRAKAPGVRTVVYMGSGYASSGTGRGLADHFDWWWYPQYPSAFQATAPGAAMVAHMEGRRALNRTSYTPNRLPLAAMTTRWPAAVSPWLPSGLTCGWRAPDVWQFTDNWRGLDASVSTLTLDQLAGRPAPVPTEQETNAWVSFR